MTLATSFENVLRVTDPDSDLRSEAVDAYKPHLRRAFSLTLDEIEAIVAFFKDDSLSVSLSKDNNCEIFSFDSLEEAQEDKDISRVILAVVTHAIDKIIEEAPHAENQTS